MKVQNITDIEAFFKSVDESKGRVEIPELEIIAYEKEDTDRLIGFMINGE